MKTKISKTEKPSIEEEIGGRLHLLRLESGLTLEDVDEQIGGRKGTTRAFEEGKRFLGPSHLLSLSRALKVDVSLFFQGTGKTIGKMDSLAQSPEIVDGARRLLNAYYKIEDPELRRSVIVLLKDIANDKSFNKF